MTSTLIPDFFPALLPLLLAACRASGRALRRLARQAQGLIEAERQRRQAQARWRALRELDDRTLRDLGIDRSELPSIARDPIDPDRVRLHP